MGVNLLFALKNFTSLIKAGNMEHIKLIEAIIWYLYGAHRFNLLEPEFYI